MSRVSLQFGDLVSFHVYDAESWISVSYPFITGARSLLSVISLIYSVIITPVFEELIFRGYTWNLIENKYGGRLAAYIITTMLFAAWHLGSLDIVAFRVSLKTPDANLARGCGAFFRARAGRCQVQKQELPVDHHFAWSNEFAR